VEFAKVGYLQFKYTALRIFYPSNSHLISAQKYTFLFSFLFSLSLSLSLSLSRHKNQDRSSSRDILRAYHAPFDDWYVDCTCYLYSPPFSDSNLPTCLYAFFFGSPCDTLNAYVHDTRSSAWVSRVELWTTYRSPHVYSTMHLSNERDLPRSHVRAVVVYRLHCSRARSWSGRSGFKKNMTILCEKRNWSDSWQYRVMNACTYVNINKFGQFAWYSRGVHHVRTLVGM